MSKDIQAICAQARDEFERRVEASGLETYPTRGGYLVRRWGNEGRDIPAALEAANLGDYDFNPTTGNYSVSSWPLQQQALLKSGL